MMLRGVCLQNGVEAEAIVVHFGDAPILATAPIQELSTSARANDEPDSCSRDRRRQTAVPNRIPRDESHACDVPQKETQTNVKRIT